MLSDLLTRSLAQFLNVIAYLILARAALSWFVRDASNPIFRFLTDITQPFLAPFQMLLDRLGLNRGLDFSPILALLTLQMLTQFIMGL